MAIFLPESGDLKVSVLSRVFKDTVATYKYYWFMSILNLLVKTGDTRLRMWDIIISMIANAWYPIHYFKLSFGKSDSMYSAIMKIREITGLPIDAGSEAIQETLREYFDRGDKELRKQLRVFSLNVPYRFLSPWISTSDNKEMAARSRSLENGCLYALTEDGDGGYFVDINPLWTAYLQQNYHVLLDFTYWNLTNFLQLRNPSVPNITNKLVRPSARRSLSRQHLFWDTVIEVGGPVRCIYTGRELFEKAYDLDHFLPWSFVTHDLTWNLMPSDPSVNSSKSDKIPDLGLYLPKLAASHRRALELYLYSGKKNLVVDDYMTLGFSIPDLLTMSDDTFYQVYYKTFSPLAQVAENMGFEHWNYLP